MVLRVNPFTGKKRKLPKNHLGHKRRRTMCSTVEDRMYAEEAMEAANLCLESHMHEMEMADTFLRAACEDIASFTCKQKKPCLAVAIQMVEEAIASLNNSLICIDLDSQLLDLDLDGNETPPRSYYFPPKDMRIDTFQNDDHADQQLRLSKDELRDLLRLFELDELTQVPMLHGDGSVTFCNFNREELLTHMLTKMSSRVTHKMMVEGVEPLTGGFGGSNTKWEQGHKWLVEHVDNKFCHLIGPDAVKMWVESFPSFRDHVHQCL